MYIWQLSSCYSYRTVSWNTTGKRFVAAVTHADDICWWYIWAPQVISDIITLLDYIADLKFIYLFEIVVIHFDVFIEEKEENTNESKL